MNNFKRFLKSSMAIGTGLLTIALTMLTRSVGSGQCPECGYRGELHECKHCGWVACLKCWQTLSKYNTCPKCERANP